MKSFGYKKRIKELENKLASEKYFRLDHKDDVINAREEEKQKYNKIV